MPTIHLDAEVGGGWVADVAEIQPTSSSIVLVAIKRGAAHRPVRLDLDKGMYIDNPPDGVTAGSSGTLARRIAARLYDVAKHVRVRS
jgi:hypothetical protein